MPEPISPAHATAQRQHHTQNRDFGRHGYRWATLVRDLALEVGAASVLDYGCGKGTLAPHLRPHVPYVEVHEFDPGIPGKDTPPEPADLVVCTDVMIFVEPDRVGDVLADLARLACKAVLINVPKHPAHKLRGPMATHGMWFTGLEDMHWLDSFRMYWPRFESWVVEPKRPDHTRYLWFKGFTGES
jgi:hypothetical protein